MGLDKAERRLETNLNQNMCLYDLLGDNLESKKPSQ